MGMDLRYKRLNGLSAQTQLLNRHLTERFLDGECLALGLAEPLCAGDYAFLAVVGEAAGDCATMARAARALGINPSTATRQVNRLLADGLVTKSAAPGDDRRYEIRLTPSGQRLLERMEDRLCAAAQAAYDGASEQELDAVCRFMEKCNDSMSRMLEEE